MTCQSFLPRLSKIALPCSKSALVSRCVRVAFCPLTAAVSGYYFSHPGSQYFVVGRVSKEQAEDYARRKGASLQQAERWLAANLDYDPE